MALLQPVIHVRSKDQAFRNLQYVRDGGCTSAWLISHGETNYIELAEIATRAQDKFPEFWIGLNFLDLPTLEAIKYCPKSIPAVWFDDGLEANNKLAGECRDYARQRNLQTFGGFAFKYQKSGLTLEAAAQLAQTYWTNPTTSGPGTGKAPKIEKLQKINKIIPTTQLAVASGISLDNAAILKEHIGFALVASSLSQVLGGHPDFHELDPDKIRALQRALA